MKWRDPMPTNCPACGARFPVPVAALRSLRAACPDCGASLAPVGERMLAEEARVHREAERLLAEIEKEDRAGEEGGAQR